MLRIGLTGGIGSGKSTVARLLAERGARVVDADVLARDVVAAGTPGLAAVVEAFGEGVVTEDGALDRPALAAVVFGDPDARATLDGIVHPLVRARAVELVEAMPDDAVVVQDIPLLVETGQAGSFDLVLVVQADVVTRVSRLVDRGLSEDDARARIAAQATDEQRRAVADVVLDNDGDLEHLATQVDRFWAEHVARRAGGSMPVADDERHRSRRVELLAVDEPVLARLVQVAVSGAEPDEVTPPRFPGGWGPERIEWFRGFHRDRRAGLDGPAAEETWAVAVDGDVVGAARLQRTEDPDVLETGIWLGRDARGSGSGRQAMARLLDRAGALGARQVRAETGRGNAPALSVLRSLGFETSADGDRVVAVRRFDQGRPGGSQASTS